MTVLLIATITKGEATRTKQFIIIIEALPFVPPTTDEEDVGKDKEGLDEDTISGGNDTDEDDRIVVELPGEGEDEEDKGLPLPTEGTHGSTITWSADPAGYIGTTPNVNLSQIISRPSYSEGDVLVTLTATIRKSDAVTTSTYTVLVKALPAPTQDSRDIVENDKAALELGFAAGDAADHVTGNITLPQTGPNGSTITWTTNRPGIITNNGTVNRPLADIKVRVSARLELDGFFREKEFILTVKGTSTVDLTADHAALQIIYADGDNANSVTKSLFLQTRGETGSNVTWEALPAGVVNLLTGRVTRPGFKETDIVVTFTATLTNPADNSSTTKVFTLTVKAMTEQDAADDAARSLTTEDAFNFGPIDTWESITVDFLLLQQGITAPP